MEKILMSFKPLAITFAASLAIAGCAGTGTSSMSNDADVASEADVRAEAPRIVSTTEFLAFLDSLETDIDNGEPRELTEMEMRRFDRLSGELREMLVDVDSVEQLNNNEQTLVYNKTQELWAAVVGRADDQVICRREHRIGTNFKSTRCRTIEQIREDQRQASRYLRVRMGPGPMPQGG